MQDWRCYHAHPDFPEQKCNALLFKGWFSGSLEFRCWRCKKPAIFERLEDARMRATAQLVTAGRMTPKGAERFVG